MGESAFSSWHLKNQKKSAFIITAKGIMQIKQNRVLFVQCLCGMN